MYRSEIETHHTHPHGQLRCASFPRAALPCTECAGDDRLSWPAHFAAGKIVGPKFSNVLAIVRAINPKIKIAALANRVDGKTPLELEGETPSELDAAELQLITHVETFLQPSNPSPDAPVPTPVSRASPRYIYIDISNIMISSQYLADGTIDRRMRLNIPKLCALLEARQLPTPAAVRARHVVGSSPSSASPFWDKFKKEGYSVKVLARKEGGGEVGVDETLHAQILTAIVNTPASDSTPPTLVLVTGDGNSNGTGYSNFTNCATAALKHGWRLELWAWNRSLSNTLRKLHLEYSDRVAICLLDEHRSSILYQKKEWVKKVPAGPTDVKHAPAGPTRPEQPQTAPAPTSPSAAINPEQPQPTPAPTSPSARAEPGVVGDDCIFSVDCVVCYERTAVIVVQPCNHLVVCEVCEALIAECPICRPDVPLRAFLP